MSLKSLFFMLCLQSPLWSGREKKKERRKETGATRIETYPSGRMEKRNLTFTRLFRVPWQTPLSWYCFSDVWRQKHVLPVTGDFILKHHNKVIKIKNRYTSASLHAGRQAPVKMSQKQIFTFLKEAGAVLVFCTPSNETKKTLLQYSI